MDFQFSTKPSDFPHARSIAEKVVPRIKAIYREKSLLAMLRCSRGSVLIQNGQVLTKEVMEKFLTTSKLHKKGPDHD